MLMTDTFVKHLKPETIIKGKPALPPGKPQRDLFDSAATGLVLRLTSKGSKTWNYIFKNPTTKKRTRMAVGSYPEMGLADAREKVREHHKVIATGRDPAAKQVGEDATMEELIKARIAAVQPIIDEKGNVVSEGLRSAKEIERKYRQYVLPLVGKVLVKDFEIRPHYKMIMDAKRTTPRMAGLIGTELKTLFKFAVNEGFAKNSPIALVKVDTAIKAKDRWLTTDEIVAFWLALPSITERQERDVANMKRDVAVQRIMKLILLTGCRPSEVCQMPRDELEIGKKLWTIDKSRVKNGKTFGDFKVPLSDQAVTIIREAMRDTNNPKWLFPNEGGENPLRSQALNDCLRKAFEDGVLTMPKFTPHDLRRTVGTQMLNKKNGLNISRFDKGLVLNHRSVTDETVSDKHYDCNEYLDEKREALAKWGTFIENLTTTQTHQLEAAE